MPEMIPSKNSLFLGEMVEKPLQASSIDGPDGEPIYTCPHCRNIATIDECDCCGAEPNCVFCNQCNREFAL